MKLHYKLMILAAIGVIVVVGFISIVNRYQMDGFLETQMGSAAADMSATIAHMSEIGRLLASGTKDGSIQSLIEKVRKETRYQYIIVMDMDGIQYSYPYTSGLYKPYKNGGEGKVLETGLPYISADANELISAIRSFHPIEYNGDQVGAVLVGLLTDQVQAENTVYRRSMESALVIGLLIGIFGAYFLAVNIKKSIYGLEPKEIAVLLGQRELIFQSIERGIVALDQNGRISLCNTTAKELLSFKGIDEDASIKLVSKAISEKFEEAMACECNSMNETIILNNNETVLMSLCMMRDSSNTILGAVISLEDLTQVRKLAEEITDYRMLVDTLRAQNHEFMNKLQTISGLIQLEDYEELLNYIEHLSQKNYQLHHLLSEHVSDKKIAGMLLTKYAIYAEKKINFVIDPHLSITGLPPMLSSDAACSIIGNLLDNSMDAVSKSTDKSIHMWIEADDEGFDLEICNSGPPITKDQDRIFKPNYSTKGPGRGYGLYVINEIVTNAKGRISYENDEGVKWHVTI